MALFNFRELDSLSFEYYVILMAPLSLLLSIPIRMARSRLNIKLPQNFFLLLVSAIVGIVFGIVWPTHYGLNVQTDVLIGIYLPMHVIATIYKMEYYIFIRGIWHIILLSQISAVIWALLLGLLMTVVMYAPRPFYLAMLITLSLVPVYSYEVVAILKELSKYRYLGTMLEGESVMSLIPATILYECFIEYLNGTLVTWDDYVIYLLRAIILGLICGVCYGQLTSMFLRCLYSEPVGALGVSVGMIYLSYFTAEFLLSSSGSLSVVCVSCFIVFQKHRFSVEVDDYLSRFWRTLAYMTKIVFMCLATMDVARKGYATWSVYNLYDAFIGYLLGNILKILCHLFVGMSLSWLSYKVNYKCLLVLGISNVKGAINMLMVLDIINKDQDTAKSYSSDVLIYVILTQLINATCTHLVLKMIGLSDLSSTKKTDMNNCMKFMMEKRLCVINVLKHNRYLADANWALVRAETLVKHPFKMSLAEDDDEDFEEEDFWNRGGTVCPDCFKEVTFDLTDKEYDELLKESQLKILKAKKVCVIKQYENGTITKNSMQLLVHNFDIMMESESKVKKVNLKPFFKSNKFLLMCQKVFLALGTETPIGPPQSLCKKICYYLIMHVAYEYVFFALTLLQVASLILIYYFDYMWNLFVFVNVFPIINIVFKFFAYSEPKASGLFKNFWNNFDFTFCIVSFVCVFMEIYQFYNRKQFLKPLQQIVRVIYFLKLLRVLYLLKPLSLKIAQQILSHLDSKVCFGFLLAMALQNCCDEILSIANQLIERPSIRMVFVKQLKEEKAEITELMENIQETRPWIGITAKTKQAIRITLHAMEDSLNNLKSSGFVDSIEYGFIYKEILAKYKQLRNTKLIQLSPPRMIFKEVPWMADDEKINNFLLEHAETVSWEVGEVIVMQGKRLDGVYIVLSGFLRLRYDPNDRTIENLFNFGSIPVIDYLSTINLQQYYVDVLMSGDSFGELALLTQRPSDCTIMARSPAKMYYLSENVVNEAMQMSSHSIYGLEARLWKYAILNLVVALLQEIPAYKTLTEEQLKYKLERAFSPSLKNYKMFVITELMDEVFLLEGMAADYNTGNIFTAPICVPRTVQKLILPTSGDKETFMETRILIIPTIEAKDYEIMEYEEEAVAELITSSTSKCMLHTVQDQHLPLKRLKASEMSRESQQMAEPKMTEDSNLKEGSYRTYEIIDDEHEASSLFTLSVEDRVDSLQAVKKHVKTGRFSKEVKE